MAKLLYQELPAAERVVACAASLGISHVEGRKFNALTCRWTITKYAPTMWRVTTNSGREVMVVTINGNFLIDYANGHFVNIQTKDVLKEIRDNSEILSGGAA